MRPQVLHALSPCHHVAQTVAEHQALEGVLRSQSPAQAEAHSWASPPMASYGQVGDAFPLSPPTWNSPA